MRWSVIAALIFVALLVIGIRSTEPMAAPAIAVAHAGPTVQPPARGESSGVEWQGKLVSFPFVKRDDARRDALAKAQDQLATWLHAKYPEIHYTPTPDFIDRNKLIKSEKEVPHTPDADQNVEMVKVEMDLELSSDGLKKIREEDRNQIIEGRLLGLARIVGGLVLLFGAVAGSIRLDEWTKGYLTWPLRIGALCLGAGGAAVLWFVL